MPISKQQIDDLMNSKMYWDDNELMHEDVNDFVDNWFVTKAKEESSINFLKNEKEEEDIDVEAGIQEESKTIPSEELEDEKRELPKTLLNDEELIKRNLSEIAKWEKNIEHAYKDSKGYITTGKGIRSDNQKFYHSLDWIHKDTQKKGTYKEIEDDFQSIKNAPVKNYKASFYSPYTILRLSEEEIERQTINHLKSDLKQIRNNVNDFDKLPPELQDVIIDIQYNTGHIESFVLFQKAIKEKNIRDMIKESHRKDVSKERNKAIGQKILNISNWDY